MATHPFTRQRDREHERSLSCPMIPRTLPVAISYRGQVISSPYVNHLHDEICLARHRSFLQKKYKWLDLSWAAIAWDSFHLCGRRAANINASFCSKLVHNWLHLGTRRVTQCTASPININTCPMCSDPEDLHHLLTCKSARALRTRYAASAAPRNQLANSPGQTALFQAIKQWTLAPDLHVHIRPGELPTSLEVVAAIQSQAQIGWEHLSAALSVLLGERFMLRMKHPRLPTGNHWLLPVLQKSFGLFKITLLLFGLLGIRFFMSTECTVNPLFTST